MVKHGPKETRRLAVDAATKLLDCKQFIKSFEDVNIPLKSPRHIWCHVVLADQLMFDPTPPPELLVLPANATVGDLKTEASKVFQEVYAMFKKLRIGNIMEFGQVEDSVTLGLLIGTSQSVKVQGKCPTKYGLNRFRMERGTEEWTVDCTCGAKDDDGERMLACDSCEVWQHTRCAGIDNSDDIPAKFICERCVKACYNGAAEMVADSSKDKPFSVLPARDPCKDTLKITIPNKQCFENPQGSCIGEYSEEISNSSEDSTLTVEQLNENTMVGTALVSCHQTYGPNYGPNECARVSVNNKRCREDDTMSNTSSGVDSLALEPCHKGNCFSEGSTVSLTGKRCRYESMSAAGSTRMEPVYIFR